MGKVDVKRETKKSKQNLQGKIKVPGRDLKEVNIDSLQNYDGKNKESKIVKRDAGKNVLEDFLNTDSKMMQREVNENLKTLAIVGAGMGIIKRRHLLSDNSSERLS